MLVSSLIIPTFSLANENSGVEFKTDIYEIYVNDENKGNYFVFIEDDDILLKSHDFEALGFANVPAGTLRTGEEYISLLSLDPSIKIDLNTQEFYIRILTPPNLLKTKSVYLSRERPLNVLYPKESSAFMNYSVNLRSGNSIDTLNIPFESGVQTGDYFAYSNFFYEKRNGKAEFARLMSNIIKDDRKTMRRITFGDFIASSASPIGGSENIGGIRISKEFSIDPYFLRYDVINIGGYLQTPSDLELYLNGVLLKREHFSPGGFELLNLPATSGLQNIELVLRDAYGRTESLIFPYYLAPNVLKVDLHDYSYGFGFRREDFGKRDFEYSNPIFSAYHRFGIKESLTIGIRAEGDSKFINLGPLTTFLIGKRGVIDAALAFSSSDIGKGYSGSMQYSYASKKLSIGLLLEGFSREYTNLSFQRIKYKPKFIGSFNAGCHLGRVGSLSLGLSMTERYRGLNSRSISTYFNRSIFRNTELYLKASFIKYGGKSRKELFAGVNFYLGRAVSAGLNYQKTGNDYRETAYLQKSPPAGEGFGYRFITELSENSQSSNTSVDTFLQYKGRSGIYTTEYSRLFGKDYYSLTLAGGLALINKSLYFSRPIKNSFGLVNVADIENVSVYLSNQEIGKTGKTGACFVPDLIPYYYNKISIEDRDIPMDYYVGQTEQYVSPPLKGGATVKFDVKRVQYLTGSIFLVKKGIKFSPEFGMLGINISGRYIEAVIGKGGEFYVEHVKPGTFSAIVIYDSMECEFDIIVPVSKEMTIDLGELVCEIK